MKKSELENLIMNWVYEHYLDEGYNSFSSFSNRLNVKELIYRLEEIGMKPPLTLFKNPDGYDIKANKWEIE